MKPEIGAPAVLQVRSFLGDVIASCTEIRLPLPFLDAYLLSQGYHKEFQTYAETPSRNVIPTAQPPDPCYESSPPFCPEGRLVCAGIRTRVIGSCRSSFFLSPLSSSPFDG